MEDNKKEIIFTFTFNVRGSTDPSSVYTVWSYNKSDVLMFIKQHNFEHGEEYIQVKNVDISTDVDSCSFIEQWVFKSNKNNDKYEIYTTKILIENAIQRVCVQLSESMIFGSAILKSEEIPMIKYINDRLGEIPYIYPKEYNAVNGDIPDDAIYTAVFDDLLPGIANITIEAYISYFVEYLLGVVV